MATMQADDLAPGKWVTVLSWHPVERDVPADPLDFGGGTKTVTHRDGSYRGEVMQIVAVNLPFVIVDIPGYVIPRLTLDTRRCELMRLTDDFVAANPRMRR